MMKQYDFEVEIEMTARISETVVKEMVTSIVEKQTGRKVKALLEESKVGEFGGYTVIFDANTKIQSFKPSKQFIVNNFGAEE